jgi:NitT/TauT family transport system substrate-binding protein
MVAITYQNAPYAIYSLTSGANVSQPKQLEGLEIASGAGSATPKVILGFMKDKGLDTSKVKFTNVDGAARVPLLLAGKIPAIETFILAKPGIERSAGQHKVTTFLLADHGLQLYSGGIIVTEAFLKSQPDVVRTFVKASMMGWHDAMANPDEAAKLMNAQVPTISVESITSELAIVRGLAVTEDVKAKGFGTLDPKKFAAGVNFLGKNMEIPSDKLPIDAMYSVDYLPTPAIKP